MSVCQCMCACAVCVWGGGRGGGGERGLLPVRGLLTPCSGPWVGDPAISERKRGVNID